MEQGDQNSRQVIATHRSGTVSDPKELNAAIAQEWRQLLQKPGKKAEIAREFGVDESELSPDAPPFVAETGPAGVFGTIILILLAKGFVGGVGAAAGKASFDYVRSLWTETAKPLEHPSKEIIGGEVKDPEAGPQAAKPEAPGGATGGS